jgi:uncharacterized protein YkwD
MAKPMEGRPQIRRFAAALTLSCAVLATVAGAAAATPLTLRVVNERGVAQASLVGISASGCGGSCGTLATDGHGVLTFNAQPGDQLAVGRGPAAPEGAGVQYAVPDPVPAAAVTVTLPALPGTRTPAVDAAERWLFDRVNEERASRGLGAFALSSTLTRAADAYAHYLEDTGQFSHTALADPGVRAVDQGWPSPGGNAVGETLALAPTKESAFDGWKGSAPHWTLLMNGSLDSVGVARAGDRWIMMPALCAGLSAPERCGLGLDPGVVPAGAGETSGPAKAGGEPTGTRSPGPGGRTGKARGRRPGLRMRVHRRGRRLVVAVRVAKGRGHVHVSVRRGHELARLRHARRGRLHRYVARLPGAGRWTIAVRLNGTGGWRDRALPKRSVRVR